MNPDFIIIGAPKAGTTSLWRLIAQHPCIFPCATKEPGFFMRDEVYQRGWGWYQSLFAGKDVTQLSGEATTEYSQTTTFSNTVDRIAEKLPGVKLIFIMRHPFEILESRWRQSLHNRDPIPREFSQALKEYPPLLENALFAQTIDDYLARFPREQLLLLLFDDFKTDSLRTCQLVFKFLGVDPNFAISEPNKVSNSAAEKHMDSSLASLLRKLPFFEPVRNFIPLRIRTGIRRMARHRPPEVTWTADLIKWVRDRIEEDVSRALIYAGKREDYWDLSGAKFIR